MSNLRKLGETARINSNINWSAAVGFQTSTHLSYKHIRVLFCRVKSEYGISSWELLLGTSQVVEGCANVNLIFQCICQQSVNLLIKWPEVDETGRGRSGSRFPSESKSMVTFRQKTSFSETKFMSWLFANEGKFHGNIPQLPRPPFWSVFPSFRNLKGCISRGANHFLRLGRKHANDPRALSSIKQLNFVLGGQGR